MAWDMPTILLSFLITWSVGLTPPLVLRYAIRRRPFSKWAAAGICFLLLLFNFGLFRALGSQSKTHAALVLVAFVSYWILSRGATSATPLPAEKAAEPGDVGQRLAFFHLPKYRGWVRMGIVLSVLWLGVVGPYLGLTWRTAVVDPLQIYESDVPWQSCKPTSWVPIEERYPSEVQAVKITNATCRINGNSLLLLLGPLLIGWSIIPLAVWTIGWISAGFRTRSS